MQSKSIKLCLMTVVLLMGTTSLSIYAQAPSILWTKMFGSSVDDYISDIRPTADGGFVLAGQTGYAGQFDSGDLWIVRTNAAGDTLWSKTYAGPGIDNGRQVLPTPDGGFMIAGYRTSADGFDRDAWLLRTDSQGDTLWTKTYGGPNTDELGSMVATADGGYILTGRTRSFGPAGLDVWIVRTDANGDTLWTQAYGGPGTDFGATVAELDDGGFIAVGRRMSFTTGAPDIWLLRMDSAGDTLWSRLYNGPYFDWSFDDATDLEVTADGGFAILADIDGPSGGTVSNTWLVRTDANGDTLWTQTYRGPGFIEQATDLQLTSEGGFLVSGFRFYDSFNSDAIIMGIGANGDSLWTLTVGDSGLDRANVISQTADGGFIVGGYTSSYSAQGYDGWMIRLSGDATAIDGQSDHNPLADFQLHQNYPNPFNPVTNLEFGIRNSEWIRLTIYDLSGREVKTLLDEPRAAGNYTVLWSGTNDAGEAVASGNYFYRLQVGSQFLTRRMVLMK